MPINRITTPPATRPPISVPEIHIRPSMKYTYNRV